MVVIGSTVFTMPVVREYVVMVAGRSDLLESVMCVSLSTKTMSLLPVQGLLNLLQYCDIVV